MSRVLALNEEDCSIDARDDIIQYYVLELIDRLGSNPLNELDGEVLEELRQDEWHYDVSENLDNVVAFSFQTDSAEMSESKAGEGYDNPCTNDTPRVYRCPKCDGLIDVVTQTPIPRGAGVCVDKACYDGRERADNLFAWLRHKATVPHTTRRMTPAGFRDLIRTHPTPRQLHTRGLNRGREKGCGLAGQFEFDCNRDVFAPLDETISKINLDINYINILNEPFVLSIRENSPGRNRPEALSG